MSKPIDLIASVVFYLIVALGIAAALGAFVGVFVLAIRLTVCLAGGCS